MANYELTVSMGYVPTWTHVDAVREIFQNAKDEETVNPENKMFFDYNEETETLMIGNKTGKLNKSTLLIGISDKRNDNRTIGQHGEGYKIATVVLLREGLSLKIYNFGCNEVWTAKKIKSRRYGVDIPAFDIQKAGSLLRPVANHDLVFEIQGITAEMYKEILESNLYLQEREGLLGEVMQANNSRILLNEKFKGMIFVSGLYVCTEDALQYGYDMAPERIRLDRDRHTVAGWELQNATARVIASTSNTDFIKKMFNTYDGEDLAYCKYLDCVSKACDEEASDFFAKNGNNAVIVTSEEERSEALTYGATPYFMNNRMAEMIRSSTVYTARIAEEHHAPMPLSEKLKAWFSDAREHLPVDLEEQGEELLEEVYNAL